MTSPIHMRLRQLRDDESGTSPVYIAIGFMTFVAASTFAVDVGTFMSARSQAQKLTALKGHGVLRSRNISKCAAISGHRQN